MQGTQNSFKKKPWKKNQVGHKVLDFKICKKLQGNTQKLPHKARLKVNRIELTPETNYGQLIFTKSATTNRERLAFQPTMLR